MERGASTFSLSLLHWLCSREWGRRQNLRLPRRVQLYRSLFARGCLHQTEMARISAPPNRPPPSPRGCPVLLLRRKVEGRTHAPRHAPEPALTCPNLPEPFSVFKYSFLAQKSPNKIGTKFILESSIITPFSKGAVVLKSPRLLWVCEREGGEETPQTVETPQQLQASLHPLQARRGNTRQVRVFFPTPAYDSCHVVFYLLRGYRGKSWAALECRATLHRARKSHRGLSIATARRWLRTQDQHTCARSHACYHESRFASPSPRLPKQTSLYTLKSSLERIYFHCTHFTDTVFLDRSHTPTPTC
jgi:hypothetical protein